VTFSLQDLLIVNNLCTKNGPEMYIKWKAIGLNPFAHINRMDILGNAAFYVG